MTPRDKADIVGHYLAKYEKKFSIDFLLLNPTVALQFCEECKKIVQANYSEEDILSTLLNWRKKGKRF